MKRENLRKILDSDIEVNEKIDKILDSYHSEIEPLKSELKSAQDSKLEIEEELNASKEAIKNLEKNSEDSEAIAKEIENYKTQIEELTKARDAEKVSNAIELAIIQAKGRNTKAIRALLDSDKIKLEDDGSVSGIEDQIKMLTKTDAYMFESEEAKPAKSIGYKGPKASNEKETKSEKSTIEKFVKRQNEANKGQAATPLFSE